MPTVRIPLVGVHNQRSIDADAVIEAGKDQRFVNVVFSVVQNPITGLSTIYVEKRPGWGVSTLVASGQVSTGFLRTDSIGSVVSAFGDTNSTIYDEQISVGTITGRALHFTETTISGVGMILIRSSDGTGWYYAEGSRTQLAYTADGNNSTTITDIKISGVNSTAGLYPGQKLTAASNIPAGTRIVSVDSGAFTAVLDTATTGGAFNDLAITKEPIAKIIDADFLTTGDAVGAFVELDGYIFYPNEADGFVYGSDPNSITAFTSTNKIAINMNPDPPLAVFRHKNMIGVLGANTTELLYNPGNQAGSPLARATQFFNRVGVQNQRSVSQLADDIYFVTSSRYGDVRVMRLRDLALQPVSTPAVDKMLGTISASGHDIYVSCFQLGGYPYVSAFCSLAREGADSFLLLETGDSVLLETGDLIILEVNPSVTSSFARHLLYNAGINIWAEWDSSIPTYIAGLGNNAINQVIAASRINTSGKLYIINPAANGELYTDDGAAYTMSIKTSRMNFGTNKRKTITEIRLVCDISSGTATLSRCFDDSGTYTSVGGFDMTVAGPKVNRIGSFKGGASFKIEHSANAPFRAEAIEIDYEVAEA